MYKDRGGPEGRRATHLQVLQAILALAPTLTFFFCCCLSPTLFASSWFAEVEACASAVPFVLVPATALPWAPPKRAATALACCSSTPSMPSDELARSSLPSRSASVLDRLLPPALPFVWSWFLSAAAAVADAEEEEDPAAACDSTAEFDMAGRGLRQRKVLSRLLCVAVSCAPPRRKDSGGLFGGEWGDRKRETRRQRMRAAALPEEGAGVAQSARLLALLYGSVAACGGSSASAFASLGSFFPRD